MDADVVWNSYDQPANLTPHHIDMPRGSFFVKKNSGCDKLPAENTLKMEGGEVD